MDQYLVIKQEEPCEGRLSSTVPWEPEGETPLGDSTGSKHSDDMRTTIILGLLICIGCGGQKRTENKDFVELRDSFLAESPASGTPRKVKNKIV